MVELVLHPSGEGIVDQVGEVLLEEVDDRERLERRHQGGALLPHVLAIDDGLDGRRIGGRTPDTELFHALDQRCLGEAGRGLRVVTVRLDVPSRQGVALGERRELALLLVLGVLRVEVGDIGEAEALVADDRAARRELDVLPAERLAGGKRLGVVRRGVRRAQTDRDGLAGGVGHLRGDGALPDELVDLGILAVDLAGHGVGGPEALPRGPDGLMGLLRVLRLLGVDPGGIGPVLGAVALGDLAARRGQRGVRQRGAVRSHVGDVAGFVEALRGAHGLRRREAELATGLLLERGGRERRRRTTTVRLALDAAHPEVDDVALERPGEHLGAETVEHGDAVAGHTGLTEVLARGEPLAVELHQLRTEGTRGGGCRVVDELGVEVPVGRGDEGHALALALDDEPGGHALHATDRRALAHLLAGGGRERAVAVDAVEEATGFLGADEVAVEIARVLHGMGDRGGGDLVEHHALDRHRRGRVQHLEEVPRDGLSLAILIRREVELVGLLEQALQIADPVLLVGTDDVEGLEVVLDVQPEDLPLALHGVGHIGCPCREVPDVTDRGLDGRRAVDDRDVGVREEALDGPRLGGRLHDDQCSGHVATG